MRNLVITLLTLFWAIVLLLVGGRFLALLAGANRSSELIEALYRYSEFWVSPFFNMFGLSNEGLDGGGTLEPASLIAFIVYVVIGMLIMALINGALMARLRHA